MVITGTFIENIQQGLEVELTLNQLAEVHE